MGLLEMLTHKEEIENLLTDAQEIYDTAKSEFETQKVKTSKSLEKLGKIKIRAWSEGMVAFVSSFGMFKNVELNRIEVSQSHFFGYDEEPKEKLMNIENTSLNASEIAKAGFAAVGTGALVGVAAYGGAMMIGSASTGTAIATLTGAAKTNATLAWFGGGAKAAGGFGMAAGKLVLAGVVVAPILAVAAVIAGVKGKERLEEAKKIYADVENAVAKMDTITTGMLGIEKMSDNYSAFIKKFNKKFAPFIKELNRIKSKHTIEQDGFIDFDSLSTVEQKTLHLSWLMAQIYYRVLATPILTSNGKVSKDAQKALSASKADLKQVRKDTYRMVDEDAPVGNLVWKPVANKMIVINLLVMVVFIAIGVLSLGTSVLKGILFMVCAVLACPIFFFRKLPASRLYVWRIIRLIASIGAVIAIAVLL